MNTLGKLNHFILASLITAFPSRRQYDQNMHIFMTIGFERSKQLFGGQQIMGREFGLSFSSATSSYHEVIPIKNRKELYGFTDYVGVGRIDGDINRLCKEGRLKEAVDMLDVCDQLEIRDMSHGVVWNLHANCLT